MHLMTNVKFFLLIFSLFLSGLILPISYAQAPAVITSFTVLDPNGNDVTDEFLVAGGSYTINFEIEIGATFSAKSDVSWPRDNPNGKLCRNPPSLGPTGYCIFDRCTKSFHV